MAGPPAQLGFGQGGIGDEGGRIARTRRPHLDVETAARHLAHRLRHLLDREALTVAEVEAAAPAAVPQPLEGQHVRLG